MIQNFRLTHNALRAFAKFLATSLVGDTLRLGKLGITKYRLQNLVVGNMITAAYRLFWWENPGYLFLGKASWLKETTLMEMMRFFIIDHKKSKAALIKNITEFLLT